MTHEHLLLHRQRAAELERAAHEHRLARTSSAQRRAERLARRAERLLERAADLSGPAVAWPTTASGRPLGWAVRAAPAADLVRPRA